jgi:hypothetical protein
VFFPVRRADQILSKGNKMADNQWDSSGNGNNFGIKFPDMPKDNNIRTPAVLMVAIVSGGKIVKYLPLKARDNGDGTATLITATS